MTQSVAPECLSEDAILQEMRANCPQALTRSGNPTFLDVETIRQASDPKLMSATFAIVTRGTQPNAHGNKVQILPGENGKGMQTHWHQVAPIVLLEHGFDFPLPIGLAEDANKKYTVTLSEKKATSTVYFTQSLPEAVMAFALVNEGVLRMASVGYRAMKGLPLELKPERLKPGVVDLQGGCYRGFDFTESILLEWSIVGNGADKGSLRQALDRGTFAGERVTQSMRTYMESQIGDVPVSVPGFRVERQVGELTLALSAPGGFDVETWKQAENALNAWSPEPAATSNEPAPAITQVDEQPAATTPSDTIPDVAPTVALDESPPVTQSLSETHAPDFAPEALAQAFRERQGLAQPTESELTEAFAGALQQTLARTLEPLMENQRRLESELERRLGKVPEPTAAG